MDLFDKLKEKFTGDRTGTTWYSGSILLINACLAPGIVELPHAMAESGSIITACMSELVLLLFISGGLVILNRCAKFYHEETMQDVIGSMCGRVGKWVCCLALAVYCYFFCISSLVIIEDQWSAFLTYIYGENDEPPTHLPDLILVITSTIIILPLCFSKHIEFLSFSSVLGVIAVLACVILVIYKYIEYGTHHSVVVYNGWDIKGFISSFPDWCSNYQCHAECVPIYASMLLNRESTSRYKSLKLVLFSMFCVSLCYTITAIFGYLTFGDDVANDVLLSYPASYGSQIAGLAIAVKLYMTYPILNYVGRRALDSMWVEIKQYDDIEAEKGELKRRIGLTLVTFVIVLILGILVPNISVAVPGLGSLAAVLMFVFPGLCLLQYHKLGEWEVQTPSRCNRWAPILGAIVFIALGGFIFGYAWTNMGWEIAYKDDFLEADAVPDANSTSLDYPR